MSPNSDNQKPPRTIDERIDALTGNFEQLNAIAKEHAFSLKLHANMIVSLDRIAEIHERRLTEVEDDRPAK